MTNEHGEVTSHLKGLLTRTLKMLEYGIKPIYVFDGKPPELKANLLEKRKMTREKAEKEFQEAKEAGDEDRMEQLNKRTVKVGQKENNDCKKLLKLMGIPYIEAPSEAEAQCTELAKGGIVYGTATEDMDALTFNTPILLRRFTASENKKEPIREYDMSKILAGLGVTMDQFIDICILCGCDYCVTIKGVGPKKAYQLIKEFGSIEEVLKHLKSSEKLQQQYPVSTDFEEQYPLARGFFKDPEVIAAKDIVLKWEDPDLDGLIEFLVKEKGFNEENVKSTFEKIKKARKTSVQQRLGDFFHVDKKKSDEHVSSSASIDHKKRKKDADKKGAKKIKI